METDGNNMKQSDLSRIDLVSKYASLQEELTSLAVFIDETRRTLGGVHEKLPSASDALTGVTKATERATHNILEHIEKLMENDGDLMGPVGVVQSAAETSGDAEFKQAAQAIADASDHRMMALTEVMTELSFQDLTCQAIQKISVTMVEIERRIHGLIETGDAEEDGAEDGVGLLSGLNRLEETASGQSRQDLVDKMLETDSSDPEVGA